MGERQGHACGNLLRGAVRLCPHDQKKRLLARTDRNAAFNHRLFLAAGDREPLGHLGAENRVFENSPVPHQTHRFEASVAFGQRSPADFRRGRCRLPWIGKRGRVGALPAGIDAVSKPDLSVGLRRGKLSAQGLPAGVMIAAWGERLVRHADSAPNRGNAKQVGVKAHPAVLPEGQDDSPGGEIFLTRPGTAVIKNGGKEGEVPFNPISPRCGNWV